MCCVVIVLVPGTLQLVPQDVFEEVVVQFYGVVSAVLVDVREFGRTEDDQLLLLQNIGLAMIKCLKNMFCFYVYLCVFCLRFSLL